MQFFFRLGDTLNEIAGFFYTGFRELEDWPPPFPWIADLFLDIAWLFEDAAEYCYRAGTWSDQVMDDIKEALWSAWDALDLATAAWNRAAAALTEIPVSILQKLEDAYNAAMAALTEIPSQIIDKLTIAYNLASTALQAIPAWIRVGLDSVNSSLNSLWDYAETTVWNKAVEAWNKAVEAYNHIAPALAAKAQEIYAWVKSIPGELRDYVTGVVADIGAVTKELVQTLINNAMSTIAAPINLINTWFDAIQEFFNDPLDWLWDRFTDWFLGKEK